MALMELAKFDSRATSVKDFSAYLKARYQAQAIVGQFYNHHAFHVDRWYNTMIVIPQKIASYSG